MELIELTQKFCQSNTATAEHKTSLKEGVAFKYVVSIGFNFKDEYAKQQKINVTEGAKREMNNSGSDD